MPNNDFTDFLNYWHYRSPEGHDRRTNRNTQAENKPTVLEKQATVVGPPEEHEVCEAREAYAIKRDNERSRQDQLGPGC
jgi:hypothetical protein